MACELLLSMVRFHNNDKFLKLFEDRSVIGFIPETKILEWVESVTPVLSPEIKKNMERFFSLESFFAGSIIGDIISNKINSPDELIEYLKNLPEKELIKRFLLRINKGNYQNILSEDIGRILEDENKTLIFITEQKTVSKTERINFLGFVADPIGTKRKVIELIEWFYQNVFEKDYEWVDSFIQKQEAILQRKIDEHGSEYALKILELERAEEVSPINIILVVSYYLEVGKTLRRSDDTNEDIHLFGYKLINPVCCSHGAARLFKGLEGKKSREIVRLLSEEYMTSVELAGKLDGSTKMEIELLLGKLNKAGLIEIRKNGQEACYKTNMDEIRQRLLKALDTKD